MSIHSDKLRELEIMIADRVYLQVEKWHLYLGDAGLAKDLAIECHANLCNGVPIAVRKACDCIEVKLGGGNSRLSLTKLLPPSQIIELEDILDSFHQA